MLDQSVSHSMCWPRATIRARSRRESESTSHKRGLEVVATQGVERPTQIARQSVEQPTNAAAAQAGGGE